jgi:hypothetical protein
MAVAVAAVVVTVKAVVAQAAQAAVRNLCVAGLNQAVTITRRGLPSWCA